MTVPLLDLSAQYAPLRREVLEAVTRVCDSQRFIMGPDVAALEQELADYLHVKHALGVSSGTDALLLALMALGIGEGDEVIVPTFSFFATAGAVARLGAKPVLVDIDPHTFNLDVGAVARAITPQTMAVIPVHLFGQSVDMDPLMALASQYGFAVVEDAAQAIGTTYGDRPVGGIGQMGCFSFFPSKNLGAFGDAGLVTTNDERVAHRMTLLRNHGAEPKYHHKLVGANFRIDTLQAAVLRVKLPHLAGWTDGRRANADRYRVLFAEAGLQATVTLPVDAGAGRHIYNQFVIQVPEREALRTHLDAAGVGTEIYYPVPFHRQECFAYLLHRPDEFPVAEAVAAHVLALPIYPELTEAQQRFVVDQIDAFYRR